MKGDPKSKNVGKVINFKPNYNLKFKNKTW